MFTDEMRRDPYPFYEQCRAAGIIHLESADLWMVLGYEAVKAVLEDSALFSSAAMSPGSTGKPLDWLIFKDAPRHGRLRGLVARAFTPRVVAQLEPSIRQISRDLLDRAIPRGEMDLVADYAAPLPMLVIARMLGITSDDFPRFRHWGDTILALAHTVTGSAEAAQATEAYRLTTGEMAAYLQEVLRDLRRQPQQDLLSLLAMVEVEGERLSHAEILGFFQLLLVAGSETTTNLISNAVLCLLEHRVQLALLRQQPRFMPTAIEEVLRYRSPVQMVFRTTTHSASLAGTTIPAGKLVLPVLGAANRDPERFHRADLFDVTRSPNPHLAFGQGVHFCLGAALSRLEAGIALSDLLKRLEHFELATTAPWAPRAAFHVLGPDRLPIRFTAAGVALGH